MVQDGKWGASWPDWSEIALPFRELFGLTIQVLGRKLFES